MSKVGDFLASLAPGKAVGDAVSSVVGKIADIAGQYITDPTERQAFMVEAETLKQQGIQEGHEYDLKVREQANAAYLTEVDDRKDARAREVALPVNGIGIYMMWGLGALATLGFLGLIAALIFLEIPAANREVLVLLTGILGGIVTSIYSYCFGSSAGAKASGDTMRQIIKDK